MLSVAGKAYFWLIKNWLILSTTIGGLGTAYQLISPKVDQKAEQYLVHVLQPEFQKQQSIIFNHQDSLQADIEDKINNIEGAQTDTSLIRFIVAESYNLIKKDIPRTFNRLLVAEAMEFQKDTIWSINAYTGEKLGFQMYSLDEHGHIILYEYKPLKRK